MNNGSVDPNDLASAISAGANADRGRDNPRDCGHFDIRIGRNGNWYYRGSPIGRKPLVKLFSTVLHRDPEGQFWLQTPVERGRIDVEDAPFVAVAMEVSGEGREQILRFLTNLDAWVVVDADHPIRVEVDPQTDTPKPYVRVRDNLDALIARPVFYELVELSEPSSGDASGQPDGMHGVWSCGEFFPLGRVDGVDDA